MPIYPIQLFQIIPPLLNLYTFNLQFASTFHIFSNTIVVVINLSSPIDCAWIGMSTCWPCPCNARGQNESPCFPKVHVSYKSLFMWACLYLVLCFLLLFFFYIYCFLKINIVCVPRKFTDKPDCVFFLESWLLCLLSIPLLLFFFLEWSIHIIMRSSTTFLLKSRLKPSNDLSGITGLSAWPSWSSAGFAGVTGCPSGKYSKPL